MIDKKDQKVHEKHSGTGLIFGGGIGLIIGQVIFNEVALGLVLGICFGLVVSRIFSDEFPNNS